MSELRELSRGLLDLLWPRACAGCEQASQELLCTACQGRLPWIDFEACTLCQQRARAPDADRCWPCAPRRRPLRAGVAGVWFTDAAADWIREFKYESSWQVSLGAQPRARIRAIAQAAAARVPGAAPDALVPMPLHRRRLRARGFNPSLGVARELTRVVQAPVAHALVRTRDTPSQTGLDRRARRRNVTKAFTARGPVPSRVWLVDDVVTTGATLEAAARSLRSAGAREVVGVCLARTPEPESDLRR